MTIANIHIEKNLHGSIDVLVGYNRADDRDYVCYQLEDLEDLLKEFLPKNKQYEVIIREK